MGAKGKKDCKSNSLSKQVERIQQLCYIKEFPFLNEVKYCLCRAEFSCGRSWHFLHPTSTSFFKTSGLLYLRTKHHNSVYSSVAFDRLYLCAMIVNKILRTVSNLLPFGDKKCGTKRIWYFSNSEINSLDCITSETLPHLHKQSF